MTRSREGALALALVLSAAAVLAHTYYRSVDLPNLERRLRLHERILAGDAPAPYRYRVLVPAVVEAPRRILSAVLPPEAAFLGAYALYDLASFALLLVALFAWLRRWFATAPSLVGVLFVASVLPEALRDHHYQPWSILEVGLFSAALVAMERGKHRAAVLLTVAASFNKETAFIIPAAIIAMRLRPAAPRQSSGLAAGVVCAAAWLAVTVGLRVALGQAPLVEPLATVMARNTAPINLLRAALHVSLFLGALWVFAALGWKRAPAVVRRAAWAAPLYVAVAAVWGVWYEVRLLMPLYPLLVPLGLSLLFEPEESGPSPVDDPSLPAPGSHG